MKLAKPKIVFPFVIRIRTEPAEEHFRRGLHATTNQRVELGFRNLPQALRFLCMLYSLSELLESYGVKFEGLVHRTLKRDTPLVDPTKVFGSSPEIVFTPEMLQFRLTLPQEEQSDCNAITFKFSTDGPFEIQVRAGKHSPRISKFQYPSQAVQSAETFICNAGFFRKLGLYFFMLAHRPAPKKSPIPMLFLENIQPLNGPSVSNTVKSETLESLLKAYHDIEKPIELPNPEPAIVTEVALG